MNKDVFNAAVIEDNPGSRDNLLACLEKNSRINVIGSADNGDDGIALINREKPDLVFLDVEMPGKNGFEVLEALHHEPGVIFVTAHEKFAVRAFEVNSIDYIVKPVTRERVDMAVERAGNAIHLGKADLLAALSDLLKKKNGKKRFTVKALDASGKVLAEGEAMQPF